MRTGGAHGPAARPRDKTFGEFSVALCHLDVGVAKNLGQFVQVASVHHVPTRERMPEIVKTKILNPGKFQNGLKALIHPLTFALGPRLGRK